MSDSTVIKMSRRKLLLGAAACALGGAFQPVLNGYSDEIIVRNGWLLKKSDLK